MDRVGADGVPPALVREVLRRNETFLDATLRPALADAQQRQRRLEEDLAAAYGGGRARAGRRPGADVWFVPRRLRRAAGRAIHVPARRHEQSRASTAAIGAAEPPR